MSWIPHFNPIFQVIGIIWVLSLRCICSTFWFVLIHNHLIKLIVNENTQLIGIDEYLFTYFNLNWSRGFAQKQVLGGTSENAKLTKQ